MFWAKQSEVNKLKMAKFMLGHSVSIWWFTLGLATKIPDMLILFSTKFDII